MKEKEVCPKCSGSGLLEGKEKPVICLSRCPKNSTSPPQLVHLRGEIKITKEGRIFALWLYDNCSWIFVRSIHQFLEEKYPFAKGW